MRRLGLAALVAALLPAYASAGGWRTLDGQPAPQITATQWLHVEGATPSLESLQGKVWLLNFIGIH